MLNKGVDFKILSKPANSKAGKTPISMLNSKPKGLSNLIEKLISNDAKINIESLVLLITSDEMDVKHRQMILDNSELCKKLSNKLKKDEALLIMAALMTGSYKWKGLQTDFQKLYKNLKLDYNDTINCNQLLMVASILTGQYTFKDNKQIYSREMHYKN